MLLTPLDAGGGRLGMVLVPHDLDTVARLWRRPGRPGGGSGTPLGADPCMGAKSVAWRVISHPRGNRHPKPAATPRRRWRAGHRATWRASPPRTRLLLVSSVSNSETEHTENTQALSAPPLGQCRYAGTAPLCGATRNSLLAVTDTLAFTAIPVVDLAAGGVGGTSARRSPTRCAPSATRSGSSTSSATACPDGFRGSTTSPPRSAFFALPEADKARDRQGPLAAVPRAGSRSAPS